MHALRLFLSLAIVTVLASCSTGPTCTSFKAYEAGGHSVAALDSLYPSAMHRDTSVAVFHGREQEFQTAWIQMQQDLGQHLKAQGFIWGKPTPSFNRVYFSAHGQIQTFLFDLPDTMDARRQDRFAQLLTNFANGYSLSIQESARSKFSQCGPAVFMDSK